MAEEYESFDQLVTDLRELIERLEEVRDLDPQLFDSSPEAELLRAVKAALDRYDQELD